MARRRPKTSPLEDFVGLVALLPWWACIGMALLSYLVLSSMARPVAVVGFQPGQMAQLVTRTMVQGLAMVGQFVVPLACLVAAAVSATKRRQRRSLVAGVAQSRAPDALDGMNWQEFELLVGEAFRLQGYEVTELGGTGPDGGVDLVLRKGREKFLVQCKQWKAFKVGVARSCASSTGSWRPRARREALWSPRGALPRRRWRLRAGATSPWSTGRSCSD